MTIYRCANQRCRQIARKRLDVCPRCGSTLEPYKPPRLLARPATPTSDQLAIDELTVPWDEWVRGLSAEGGQAR